MASVHTIEVTNGEGTGRGQVGVMKATEDLHEWGRRCVVEMSSKAGILSLIT
jgi:hypothetical protein